MKKTIQRFFETLRPRFEKGGRFQRWYAFYESIETIFFAPGVPTTATPHVRDSLDVKRYMASVVVVLLPLLVFGMYNTGYQSQLASGKTPELLLSFWIGFKAVIPLVIVSYLFGFGWEIVFARIRGHEISEGVFVTAMLFPLTLPPTTPLWQAAMGISFGVVIGKEIFGGTGRNFLNPALAGRAFLYFAYPVQMSGDAVWTVLSGARQTAVDAFSSATPLVVAFEAKTAGAVEEALAEVGYPFWKLFFGLYPDSIGASSTFLCLVGALVLMAIGVASYRIIVGDILGVVLTGAVLNLIATEGSIPYMTMNPLYHLIIGGTAFGIAFMTTDPVSAPDLHPARWIYGFLIGALTVLIRVFNPAFPEGIMLAILFMNVFAPLLDHVVLKFRLRRRIANV
ncbi:MAG: NADH:ubiquinone reductase (Na(+)-transporting) subunit B [Desulfobacterales bacterium]|nr:NADH:ubiquinone reductase (Na(+)-transporting) subunit B [Desulfobacterales bacterium]